MHNKLRVCYIYLIFIVCVFELQAQNIKIVDSLNRLYRSETSDNKRVWLLCTIAGQFWFNNPDTSITISQQALQIAQKNNDKKGIANCYHIMGYAYVVKGYYPLALSYNFQALLIREELIDKKAMSKSFNNIGNIYQAQKNYEQALIYFNKGLSLDEENKDSSGIAVKSGNIGTIYGEQKEYAKALEFHFKALAIDEKLQDSYSICIDLLNIGEMYQKLNNFTLAANYLNKSIDIAKEIKNSEVISNSYQILAEIYRFTGRINKSIEYAKIALFEAQEIKGLPYIKKAAQSLFESYQTINNFQNALYYHKIAVSASDSMFSNDKSNEINQLQHNYEMDKKQKEIQLLETDKKLSEQEIKNQRILIASFALGLAFVLALAYVIFRSRQKEHNAKMLLKSQKEEIEQKNDELQLKNQEILLQHVDLQLLNAELLQKNEEITTQRDEIEAQRDEIESQRDEIEIQKNEIEYKNENITNSIIYASRIQNGLLPSDKILSENFPDNFILYKPCDIVSGDFYWYKQIENYIYISVADCTGHGVPGAFMSVLGITLLTDIVNKNLLSPPNVILNLLRNQVKESLHQTGEEYQTQDGMDIAFCLIDLEKQKLQFSGAYNPLYIIRTVSPPFQEGTGGGFPFQEEFGDGSQGATGGGSFYKGGIGENCQFIEIKADRMPIGVYPKEEKDFSCHEIDLKEGDAIYLFSDGYISQFNKGKTERFKSKRFQEKLVEIYSKPMPDQKHILEKTLADWQGNIEQIDDILIIGLKIS